MHFEKKSKNGRALPLDLLAKNCTKSSIETERDPQRVHLEHFRNGSLCLKNSGSPLTSDLRIRLSLFDRADGAEDFGLEDDEEEESDEDQEAEDVDIRVEWIDHEGEVQQTETRIPIYLSSLL